MRQRFGFGYIVPFNNSDIVIITVQSRGFTPGLSLLVSSSASFELTPNFMITRIKYGKHQLRLS